VELELCLIRRFYASFIENTTGKCRRRPKLPQRHESRKQPYLPSAFGYVQEMDQRPIHMTGLHPNSNLGPSLYSIGINCL
jgi:hypothetical protein